MRWCDDVVDNEFMNKKKSKSMPSDPFYAAGLSFTGMIFLRYVQSVASFTSRKALGIGVMMTVMMSAKTVTSLQMERNQTMHQLQPKADTLLCRPLNICLLLYIRPTLSPISDQQQMVIS